MTLREPDSEFETASKDVAACLAAAISLLEGGGVRAAPSRRMFEAMVQDYRESLERFRKVARKRWP
jgi:hypothetical protein